jgi:cytochrome c
MEDRSNTIAGWVLFGMASALGFSILSGKYFHADSPEAPETPGYAIKGAEKVAEKGEDPIGVRLASADASAGEKVFQKCTACHSIEKGGANGVGPNLYGILGKPHAAVAGFSYSESLSGIAENWGVEQMDNWLKSPKRYASGTKMSFAGLSKGEDRANVIAYMNNNTDAPLATDKIVADALAATAAEGSAEENADVAPEGETIAEGEAATE